MNKTITGMQARQAILDGATILYDAVKDTYGPVSGNVGILDEYYTPTITHDGVTVAKSLDIKGDPRIGAEVIKQAALKMDDRLGDGTTTVTILAYHILNEAFNKLNIGNNPITLRTQLELDRDTVLAVIRDYTIENPDKKAIAQIAAISSGDAEIGNLIADVIEEIGPEGVITVEHGQGLMTEKEVTEGYVIEQGAISSYMIADTEKMETMLYDPVIFLSEDSLETTEQITSILTRLPGVKELLIIANEVKGEALNSLIYARVKAGINVVAIKNPSFGEGRKESIDDIRAVTGIESDGCVGAAKRVIIGEDRTTIVGAGDVSERIKHLKGRIRDANEYNKSVLSKRISDLKGKVAIIKVGGVTEGEIVERKFRVDDAVYAVRAALQGGTVAGGGLTYFNLASKLPEDSLLKEALVYPIRILLENAGLLPDDWLGKVTLDKAVDVKTQDVVNMREAGIIDPAETVREAIQNAVSVAGLAMTMKVIIVNDKDD